VPGSVRIIGPGTRPAALPECDASLAFGCARVVFNDGLRLRQQAREAWRPDRGKSVNRETR